MKWWLLLLTVIAVVVAVVILVARQTLVVSDPAPTPTVARPLPPPPATSTPAPSSVDPTAPQVIRPAGKPLLPGAGTGDVYAQSATAIFRIELGNGRVTRTPTPRLEQQSSFVAGPDWVIFKTIDNDSGVVIRNGHPASPLPSGLRNNGRLNSGPAGDLWLTPEDPTDGARIVTRVNINGQAVKNQTIRLPDELGFLESDATGYFLSVNAGGIYQHTPAGPDRLTTGQLLAVGAKQLLTWDCDKRGRCSPYLVDRRDLEHRTVLPLDRAAILKLYQGNTDQARDFGGGYLSPDATHTAQRIPGTQLDSWPLAVLDLTTGRSDMLPGSLAGSNPNTQIAWTPNGRWLLAVTDQQMRGYDTITHATRTIDLTNEQILHLTMNGATGT